MGLVGGDGGATAAAARFFQTAIPPTNTHNHNRNNKKKQKTVVQFAAVLLWFGAGRDAGVCLSPAAISLPQWLLALALVGYGQSLNAGIFSAIGHAGVYYGFKLGSKVPWVTGWPFDTVKHPQYVGSVLTVWGMAALVAGQAPLAPLLQLAAYWTALYVVTGVQEDNF